MSWGNRRHWLPAVYLLAALALASCDPILMLPPTPTLMPLAVAPQPTATATATATASVVPTPDTPVSPLVTAENPATPTQSVPTPIPSPTPLILAPQDTGVRAREAELLFAAPIPSAAEVMEWRPPCVPVPHALHPDDHYWLRRPIPSGQIDWGLDWYPYGSNGFGQWRVHHGMDFPNDPGTPVVAAGDGIVVAVMDNWRPVYIEVEINPLVDETPGPTPEPPPEGIGPVDNDEEQPTVSGQRMLGPYGNYIIIRHDWGWQGKPVYTLYAHLLEVFVTTGDHVKAGDLIAGVGNTGDSTGPHLHLEIRVGQNHYNNTRNPALWLAPYEGWGTLAGRITSAGGMLLDNAVIAIVPADAQDRESEERIIASYANDWVNPDDQWGENFIVPDLPAGEYDLVVHAGGEILEATVTIQAGATTFIHLHTRLTDRSL